MFGLGKTQTMVNIGELAGLILSEKALATLLQPNFKSRILHIGFDNDSFTLDFDQRESMNAAILGEEDVVSALEKHYNRGIIDVSPSGEGHGQFRVRFEE